MDHELDAVRARRFEDLFARVFEPLQRYARRRADEQDAQDVVADTLGVLWRQLDRVPAAAELPWCYGVARRCLANRRRMRQRQARLVERVAANSSCATGVDDGGSDGAGDGLRAAIARLPAAQQEIVRLWAWEQLEPREIALVLGVSANAVSIRLHRAKHRLREDLGFGKETIASGHNSIGTEEDRDG